MLGIINKIDKTIIDSQIIRIANASVVKDVVHECSKNHAGKKDAPLDSQFKEQKKNIYRLTGKIDNYLKYSINNKSGARDLNLNKKSDEAIISQKPKNVFDKGKFKGVPLVGAFLKSYEESKNQSYQKNECGKKRPDKAIPKIVNKKRANEIPVIGFSFVEHKSKNQCNQPRIQKLLNNDLGKFKS